MEDWFKKLLDMIILGSEQNKVEPVKIFKLTLPKLTEGWLRQGANVFGFGDFNQNIPNLLLDIDHDVLD